MTASQELVYQGATVPLTEPARDKFSQSQIDLIGASMVPAATPLPVLHRFLELSARYDLDPFTGEIWCALMAGKDGANGRVAILVGRDGYMKKAREDGDFIDVDGDVVCEKDEFKVTRLADGTRTIEHSYGNPAGRGAIIASYAVLRREGKPDRYFLAYLTEYGKDPEKSAWKYRSSMLMKASQSYLLRTTYGISGPTPADEVNSGLDLGDAASAVAAAAGSPLDALPADVRGLFERAHDLDPKSWRANEVAARVDPTDPSTLRKVKTDLEEWLEENEVADAVVVEDDPKPDSNGHDPDERYATDEEWRSTIDPLLSQRADLEAAAEEAGDEGQREARLGELEVLEDTLAGHGVPRGWMPGQATLGL